MEGLLSTGPTPSSLYMFLSKSHIWSVIQKQQLLKVGGREKVSVSTKEDHGTVCY